MIRLLVVDDNPPSREEAVRNLSEGDLIEILGEAETSDEAYKMAQQLLPDVILLDLHLPGLIQTPDLIKKLVGLKNVKVVIYASQAKGSEVLDLFECGAAAYVVKTDSPVLIRMTLLMVSRGTKNIISPTLPRNLMRLSAQERSMLKEMTRKGGPAKAAQRMGISEYDLNQIAGHLCEKLEIEDPDKLLKWAKKHGY